MSRADLHKFVLVDTLNGTSDEIQVADLWDKWVQFELAGGYVSGEVQLQGRIGDTWVNEGAARSAGAVVEVPPAYVALRVKTTVALNPAASIKVTLNGRQQRAI